MLLSFFSHFSKTHSYFFSKRKKGNQVNLVVLVLNFRMNICFHGFVINRHLASVSEKEIIKNLGNLCFISKALKSEEYLIQVFMTF